MYVYKPPEEDERQ